MVTIRTNARITCVVCGKTHKVSSNYGIHGSGTLLDDCPFCQCETGHICKLSDVMIMGKPCLAAPSKTLSAIANVAERRRLELQKANKERRYKNKGQQNARSETRKK